MFGRGLSASTSTWQRSLEVQQLRNKIRPRCQDSVQSSQRDYYLREQLRRSRRSWADQDDTQKDIADLKEKIETGECRRK